MSDLTWRSEGIAKAEAAGAITLEPYRRPGFTGSTAVRRLRGTLGEGSGFYIEPDPEPEQDDDAG